MKNQTTDTHPQSSADTTMPNSEKPVFVGKCNSIVWNLLENLTSDSEITSSIFIRELFQTERCDQFINSSSLSDLRRDYKDYLNHDDDKTFERITHFDHTRKDEEKCQQALFHYHEWTKSQLESQLPLPTRIYYHTFTNAERTFAFIGIAAFGWGAVKGMPKIVQNSSKWMKKRSKQPEP